MKTANDLIAALLNSDGPSALDALSDPDFLSGFTGPSLELAKARAFFIDEINGGIDTNDDAPADFQATMTKPTEGRIYQEWFFTAQAAVQYARESVALGWNVEVIDPDSRILFIGGPA